MATPLLWPFQAGSGTQANVNVKGAISNRAIQILGSVVIKIRMGAIKRVFCCCYLAYEQVSVLKIDTSRLRRVSAGFTGPGSIHRLRVRVGKGRLDILNFERKRGPAFPKIAPPCYSRWRRG